MSDISDIKSKCESAALLTENWMLQYLSDKDLFYDNISDPVSFYKWPLTLYARGRILEAGNLVNWIMKRSLTAHGDLRSKRAGFHKDFHSYANLWLVIAAIKLKDKRLSDKLLGFLIKYHNKKTGGMITIPGMENGITEDALSTSFLGMAACELHNSELGNLVMKYLVSLIRIQPDPHKFWLRTDQRGDLVLIPVPGADPKTYSISLGKEDEAYYFLGAISFFLAGYIETFGHNNMTNELTEWLSGMFEKVGTEALHTIWAAKVAPGAVALYKVLHDNRFFEYAIPVIDAVLGGQSEKGFWLKDDKPWVTVSAEQCYWLTFIANRL